jgi:hypothetical protein
MYKKGFVPPVQFCNDFGELGIPKVVYTGNLNRELVENVKDNVYGLREGVICKGKVKTRKGADALYYCKIKTDDWFSRLRALGNDRLLQEELAQVNASKHYKLTK